LVLTIGSFKFIVLSMNLFNIDRAHTLMNERGWDTLWWMIDIHDTIFKGKYASDQEFELYPGCVDVLKWISDQPNHEIILWTSSYGDDAQRVVSYFKEKHNIHIDFFNENPKCKSTGIADFSVKPYFNILLDDKCGGNFEFDWLLIAREIERVFSTNFMDWNSTNINLLNKSVNLRMESLKNIWK
jgi:hypothetical protein